MAAPNSAPVLAGPATQKTPVVILSINYMDFVGEGGKPVKGAKIYYAPLLVTLKPGRQGLSGLAEYWVPDDKTSALQGPGIYNLVETAERGKTTFFRFVTAECIRPLPNIEDLLLGDLPR